MHPHLNTCITYLNTLIRIWTPCIAYLNLLSRLSTTYLKYMHSLSWKHCPNIPRLNTLTRTLTYLNTLSRILSNFGISSRQPIRIEYYLTRVVNQSESSITSLGNQSNSSITSPESSANQNRVLRHSAANQNQLLRLPSRQPIRNEYYVTRELSDRVEVPSRLSARVGSL